MEEIIKQAMHSGLEGVEDRITTRVHFMRESARSQLSAEAHVPASGALAPIQDHQAAVTSEHVGKSRSSSSVGSGRRNRDWFPTPRTKPSRF